MKLLFRGLCTNTVTLYFNLMLLLMISKTTPDRGEITRRYYSTEKKRKSYIKKNGTKKYTGFEEPLLLYADVEARPE